MPENHIREKLEAAFRKLPVLEQYASQIPGLATSLLPLVGKTSTKTPPKFTRISRTAAKNELAKTASALNKLIRQLHSLHQPVIVALADRAVLTAELIPRLENIATKLKKVDLSNVSDSGPKGRPQKNAARGMADMLGGTYMRLTGKTPTITVNGITGKAEGRFISFLTDIFKLLGLKASPEAAARRVIRELKGEKSREKSE